MFLPYFSGLLGPARARYIRRNGAGADTLLSVCVSRNTDLDNLKAQVPSESQTATGGSLRRHAAARRGRKEQFGKALSELVFTPAISARGKCGYTFKRQKDRKGKPQLISAAALGAATLFDGSRGKGQPGECAGTWLRMPAGPWMRSSSPFGFCPCTRRPSASPRSSTRSSSTLKSITRVHPFPCRWLRPPPMQPLVEPPGEGGLAGFLVRQYTDKVKVTHHHRHSHVYLHFEH